MPVTFYGYGRASTDKQAMSPEVQMARTLAEYEHQKATGAIPSDTVWGGFFADTDVSRSIKFLHRPMGITLAQRVQPDDRICAAAYDRLLGSTIDACETIQWANERHVRLVIMDMRIDTSTPHGQMIAEILGAVKNNERREIGRRIRESNEHRRKLGRPTSVAPLGYKVKKIIPAGGGKPIKWFFPFLAERQYGERIVAMHDEQNLSFRRIAMKLWREKVKKPRTGGEAGNFADCAEYYNRCKQGWPLPGGVQWKAPEFGFKLYSDDVVNLTNDRA